MATRPKLQWPACAQDRHGPLARLARPKATAACWAGSSVMTGGPTGSTATSRATCACARNRRQHGDFTGGKASSEMAST
jgi:hypothetical protein